MSDKKELTKRERFLLVLVMIVAVTVGGTNFVFFPILDTYLETLDRLDNLSYQKDELEFEFLVEPLTVVLHDRAEAEYNSNVARYPAVMSNEEIDTVLTTLCLNNSIRPVSLSFSGSTVSGAYTQITPSMTISCSYESLRRLIDSIEQIDYLRITAISLNDINKFGGSEPHEFSLVFEITMFNG